MPPDPCLRPRLHRRWSGAKVTQDEDPFRMMFYCEGVAAAERPDFVLSEQLCFALASASRAMSGCYRPMLHELGLTYSQYAVMLVLWEHDTISLGFLCQQLYLDSGTLSPLVKRLAAQGLITRRRSSVDERVMQLSLTPAGRALRDKAASVQEQVVQTTGLDPAELTGLRDTLHALAARLRDTPPDGGEWTSLKR